MESFALDLPASLFADAEPFADLLMSLDAMAGSSASFNAPLGPLSGGRSNVYPGPCGSDCQPSRRALGTARLAAAFQRNVSAVMRWTSVTASAGIPARRAAVMIASGLGAS